MTELRDDKPLAGDLAHATRAGPRVPGMVAEVGPDRASHHRDCGGTASQERRGGK